MAICVNLIMVTCSDVLSYKDLVLLWKLLTCCLSFFLVIYNTVATMLYEPTMFLINCQMAG